LAAALADCSEVYRVIDTTLIPAIVRVRACRKGVPEGPVRRSGGFRP
jgi:hypothetical protein